MLRGDPDAWATQVLHIICPGLCPGEDTPVSLHGVNTTGEAAITICKSYSGGKGWDTKLIHSFKAKAHAMTGTCDTDGRRQHSKGPFMW